VNNENKNLRCESAGVGVVDVGVRVDGHHENFGVFPEDPHRPIAGMILPGREQRKKLKNDSCRKDQEKDNNG